MVAKIGGESGDTAENEPSKVPRKWGVQNSSDTGHKAELPAKKDPVVLVDQLSVGMTFTNAKPAKQKGFGASPLSSPLSPEDARSPEGTAGVRNGRLSSTGFTRNQWKANTSPSQLDAPKRRSTVLG